MSIEIGNKHKSRKEKKRSQSKKVEDCDKTKEKDQKARDKSREDKLHKNHKNNLHCRTDTGFKEKHKYSDKKHTDFSSFGLQFSSSLDSLNPHTSSGNLTYPQVRVLEKCNKKIQWFILNDHFTENFLSQCKFLSLSKDGALNDNRNRS